MSYTSVEEVLQQIAYGLCKQEGKNLPLVPELERAHGSLYLYLLGKDKKIKSDINTFRNWCLTPLNQWDVEGATNLPPQAFIENWQLTQTCKDYALKHCESKGIAFQI